MKISVKVLPRSSRDEIKKLPDGSFKVKLTSAPVDGKANDALVELLSEYFNTSKSKIKLVKGLTSKNKIIEIM
ncbi:MAG: hypothetical protein UR53_C0001G0012 [Candidatus Magasanikbacteria bacterium GW2011_GWC2_34_16]|uniref:UPF0235 protein US58_C0006G0007 n=2 Tax=Candidatus Magasanikiibacteriota TaxID=1752731 RepID=A0A0G0HCW5_9BACT|nr:MAG: hypothetical protein UR53_C0001G0012 [Candidatus Magasanikbacteria bacterium GW2011_GWC2_34_16]KKQ41028.1 MAG: hypothetical protein US58_C0006G0007 [Candidatus Magasanikbacteria bacterium GW2011_GWA2_37_8]